MGSLSSVLQEALPALSRAAFQSLAFLALAALALGPWEALLGRGPRRWRRASPSVLADLLFATVGQLAVRVGVLLGLEVLWSRGVAWSLPAPVWSSITSPGWRLTAELASGLLLFDLGGYLYHRLAHAVPALWRLHAVHHSSAHLDWLASFRQHPLEVVLLTAVQNAPLILLGIPLGVHASVAAFLKLATVFVHADFDVPHGPRTAWMSSVVATPAFHRRHHHVHGAPRNFATLFPFFDRLGGTWERPALAHQPVGLEAPLPSSFGGLLLAPFTARSGPGS